jgi:uncharacterized protein YjbI with pentapeptide repeats
VKPETVDWRSCSFNAIRTEAMDCRGVKAGTTLAWKVLLGIISTSMTIISSLLVIISASFLTQTIIVTGSISSIYLVFVLCCNSLWCWLLMFNGASKRYIILSLLSFVISFLAYLFAEPASFDIITFCLALTTAFILSGIGIFSIAQCLTFTFLACSVRIGFTSLIATLFVCANLMQIAVKVLQAKNPGSFTIAIILVASMVLTAFVISQRALRSHRKFAWLRTQAIFAAATGGTSFKGSDLSNLDFTGSILANTDFRAKKFYRTCFRDVKGLDRARLNNDYLDLNNPKVQNLLVNGYSHDADFSRLNLQGAYLQDAKLNAIQLIETNLNGADLRDADLRDTIMLRTILTGVDLSGADLTGACIKDWSINSETQFNHVKCNYIYREYKDGRFIDRYPRDRDFEPGEFASLYQEVENAVELIFKEGINWRAFAFSLQKLQLDDEGLGLQLRGIEKRGDLWVVKVTHDQTVSSAVVEQKLGATYEILQLALTAKEQQVNQLLGIVSDQAETLKEMSKKPFGNQFTITGSTITNLAGSGEIEYTEAANQIRNLIANNTNPAQTNQIVEQYLTQLQNRLAPTETMQVDLLHKVILTEAERDPLFKQFILQQSTTLLEVIPTGPIATAFQTALAILTSDVSSP